MGHKNKKITAEEIAEYVITSKETAEIFIARWMERHDATRDMALARLKELGVELSKLRDKH